MCMNRIKMTVTVLAAVLLLAINAQAQEWNQGRGRTGIYTVAVGGTQQIYLGRYKYDGIRGSGLTGAGLSMNAQGEYQVHRFVGLGWGTGVNLYFPPHTTLIEIPIGLKVNVHILEAANVNVRGLDVFAGVNLGGGPGFYSTGGATGFLYAGPQVGVRYWFNPHIAINSEFGWGQTFANLGFTF